MTKQEIEKKCAQKKDELIEKYFGNLVHEAAIERPETIGTYTDLLPKQIEEEYYEYLRGLWVETHPEGPRFEDIIDKRHLSELFTENDRIGLKRAYDDATRRTLWERLTKSNHKDVTYYKGLMKLYTIELLDCLTFDFIEDV